MKSTLIGFLVSSVIVIPCMYIWYTVPDPDDIQFLEQSSCAQLGKIKITKETPPEVTEVIEKKCPRLAPNNFKQSINKGY